LTAGAGPSGGHDQTGRCAACGSPVEPGQRYCLGCGERLGPRDPQLVGLLRRVAPQVQPQAVPVPVPAPAPRPAGLRLPTPRVSALLVLVFLGFGVLLGGAAGSPVQNTLAASARPAVRLILPPASTAPPASTSTPAEPPSSGPAESLSAEAPSTAAATASTAPATSAAAGSATPSTPSSSSGSESAGTQEGSPAPSSSGSSGSTGKPPAVKHVFLIVLSDEPYASVFGPASGAPYLSQTLEKKGELLVRYDAVAHDELANELALLSGQGPTVETAANCSTYTDIAPGTVGAGQQVMGQGCVYPHATQTLAGQLQAKHLKWRAYVQGTDEAPSRTPACGHPALGAADPTAATVLPAGQTSATFRNPFVYFHSVTDSPACVADDVGLQQLSHDLANAKSTPSLSYIVPDRCHDASPAPCAPGAPAGLAPADGFLKKVVPEILSSKAYKEGGLLVITVDQAPSSGLLADSSACCGEPRFPNLPVPTAPGGGPLLIPKGGGEVGALLLSSLVKPNSTSQEQFNHFSLLRTIEDLFGLKHLGYAGAAGVSSFGASVFNGKG